ncbi:hypothetical protein UFOVP1516_25 [uncultured Caudovirales phage]|uniref:Uncharacterized protein n=1 Tax=uncultured Caudovirales phage TaxID=2100421 RepID=A0A6J5PIE8_9CAUD|nr:hypothetical protein UFOVP887_19 [uncultured Caudovirales phage]CAB5226784.1 hypothetical protein UFOVP1516_25 [uncultured Caudovirales phage]
MSVDLNKLELWYKMQEDLKILREAEASLRSEIFKAAFPTPKEGTNKVELGDGWILNATMPITRKVDLAAFLAMKEQLEEAHISPDKMVKFLPELELKQYRCLTEDEIQLVDQFLIIKEGSPQMKVVLPASAKRKGFEE